MQAKIKKALNYSYCSAKTKKEIKVELMFLFGFVCKALTENTKTDAFLTSALYDLYDQVSF